MRIRPLLCLALASLCGWPPPAAAAVTGPHRPPSTLGAAGTPGPGVRLRPATVVIRLNDDAAAARPASAPARSARLGLPAIDAVLAGLGDAWCEREFPAPAPALAGNRGPAGDPLAGFYLVHLPPGTDRDAALGALRASPDVAEASAIALAPAEAIPNDSLFGSAWHLFQPSRHDIHAIEAWEHSRGDTSVCIAILDTGVLLHHPDLAGKLWINRAERGGLPGWDDDQNGYTDDAAGWDFVDLDSAGMVVPGEDWRDEDDDPDDFVGHGTAVAGLAGAQNDNGIGIASAGWNVRIMALRVGYSASEQPAGLIDLSAAARAMVYAACNGASVINCSFANGWQPDLEAAADAAARAGVTVVAAAGNGGNVSYLSTREEVVSVAATDADDLVARFSSRGPYVDLAAPGVMMPTTVITRPGTDSLGLRAPYYSVGASGTSFSAPLVSAAAALLQSDRRARGLPPLRALDVQMRLEDTADDISARNPGVTGYGRGRLNLLRALTDPPTSSSIAATSVTVGAGVVLPTQSGGRRYVYATSDARLEFVDGPGAGILATVTLPAAPLGGIAAADMGGGRGPCLFVALADGRIAGFDANGTPLAGWPVNASRAGYDELAEPAIGDLDGDGAPEVVWGGIDATLRAWHADGSVVAGFPRALGTPSDLLHVALADVDGRPGVEIVTQLASGSVNLLHGDGTSFPGWPISRGVNTVPPIVIRRGPSRTPTIVVANENAIKALSLDAGSVWTYWAPSAATVPLAAGDLDGDGGDEVVVASPVTASVAVLDSLGHLRSAWVWPDWLSYAGGDWPLIGSLAPGGGPALLLRNGTDDVAAMLADGTRLAAFPKPGGGGASPTFDDLDGDGRTEVVAGSGRDSGLFVYDAGPGTWNPAAQLWPTARGNAARTGCTFGSLPVGSVDDLAPGTIADLAASAAGSRSAALSWSAPADAGPLGRALRYELRRAAQAIDASSFGNATPVTGVPVPAGAGTPEHVLATGLDEGAVTWFALRSVDAAGNASAISNLATASTAALPPGTVTDLRLTGGSDSSVTLAWSATGDDGSAGRPARYLVRAAEQPLDDASFASAPIALDLAASHDAGGLEHATLGGLVRGRHYWFALKAEDAGGFRSPASNVVVCWAGPLAAHAGVALAARAQPARAPVVIDWQGGVPGTGGARRLELFDVGGRRLRAWTLGGEAAGAILWDGRDGSGSRARPGLYFARLVDGGAIARARVVLID